LFCLLPGTTYEIGNNYEFKELSNRYDHDIEKIIYETKYSVFEEDNPKRDNCVAFAFNIKKPTYKWIKNIHVLFKEITRNLGCTYEIYGIRIGGGYLEKEDWYKFGYFNWRYISEQENKELIRQIEYSGATKNAADAIAREMITYKGAGYAAVFVYPQDLPYLKRFDISYAPKSINIPMTYFTSEIYKEAILNSEIVPSISQQNSILKYNIENLRIEFVQIYESDERYIFVALYKPDKPRDAEEDYNYKYLYYTFWVDKGNYLTDALKLRKTLVNVFGEETGLNIEKEIKEQQR
jgi:hypothetical protein